MKIRPALLAGTSTADNLLKLHGRLAVACAMVSRRAPYPTTAKWKSNFDVL